MPLSIDTVGLKQGADRSAAIAAHLVERGNDVQAGAQPSHAGVAALDGAISTVRNRQAQRVRRVAADMQAGAAAYDAMDNETGGRLAESL